MDEKNQEKLPKKEKLDDASQISSLKKDIENKTEKKEYSFLKQAISSLKNFIVWKEANAEKIIDQKENSVKSPEWEKSKIDVDLLNLWEAVTISETKKSLDVVKKAVVSKKKNGYVPSYPVTKQFVENSDRGEVSLYIAQSADQLQTEIMNSDSKILQYFYS